MSRLKLLTTKDDIHELSQAAFNARDNSKHVKVPLEALKRIVMDHGTICTKFRSEIEPDI